MECQVGANAGAAISIESAGGYTKPGVMRVQADLQVSSITGTDYQYARGVGLGFYAAGAYTDDTVEVRSNFTGLVLSPAGDLYRVRNASQTRAT